MADKKLKKENAKTRYNAKNPTISFRVSRQEYERLDELRKGGRSFRTVVLLGANIIEIDEAKDRASRATEEQRVINANESAQMVKAGVLEEVLLGLCPKCQQPINRI